MNAPTDTAALGAANQRSRLDRKYLERSRVRGYPQVAGNMGAFFVLIALAAVATSVWLYPLLIFAIGCAQHRMFFPIHDCIHHSLFPTRRENLVVGTLMAPLIGTSFGAIHDQHMNHHRDFGGPEDPGASDYFVRFCSRLEFVAFLLGPLVGSVLFAKAGDYLVRPGNAAKRHVLEEEWIFTGQLQSYAWIFLAQAVICAVLTSGFASAELWRYPVFYVLPLVTVFLFFNRLRMFAEHGSLNYDVCDYLEGKRPTARTIYASWVERVFLCGSSFNFHHEHHRYPMVPGWQLPRLHGELEPQLDPEDVRPTYFRALRELWGNLPDRAPKN
jgi:fatty acid desaturase